MFRGKFAAFVAVMSILILFGGCGGGGGGGVPPTSKTTVTGTVVDPTDQAVVGAKVSWQWWQAKSRSRQTETLTVEGGKFALEVPAKTGQIMLVAVEPNIGRAQTLPIELNGGVVPMSSVIKLAPVVRQDQFDPNTVEVGHRIVVKLGERTTDKIEVLRMIKGQKADLSLADNVIIAQEELTTELLFHFNNIPAPDGAENWRVSAILEFVRALDRTKPLVTQVLPLEGELKGTITIEGTAVDPDGRPSTRAISEVFRLQKSGGEIVVESTPTSSRAQIEAPPSGVDFVLANEASHELGRDNSLVSDKFAISLDTTQLSDGSHDLSVVAQDKADNSSDPIVIIIKVKNVPDPKPDPWDEMDTIDRPLVMVDEPARYIGDYWKYDGTVKFENISVDEKDQLLVYAGSVVAYPRTGDPYVWAPNAWDNGRSTYSPQGYWYATGLSGEFWRFDPRTNKLDHVTLDRPGTSWMCKADNTGPLWVDWSNGHFTCLSADLKTVLKDLDLGTNNTSAFAVDTTKDALVYADSFLDEDGLWKGRMTRHRISTGEKFVLWTCPEVFGCGGIEIDPTHGQVIAEISFGTQSYLVQLGKKDGQWGELYQTPMSISADQLVRGATFDEYYTSHSDWKPRKWRYQ